MKKLPENIIKIENTDIRINIRICNFIKFSFLNNTNTREIKYKKLSKKLYKKRNLLKFLSFFIPYKKYRYIIPFGQNCDFSKCFLDYFKYNDSTLYNWCATGNSNIAQQFDVLENPQILFSGEYYYNNLWKCSKTQLSFHGRSENSELKNEDGTYNEKLLEEDLKELKSRATYLANKTTKYLKTQDKKLIVYTILCSKDKMAEQASKAVELYESLKNRNIQNFDLLVICARQHYQNISKIINSKYPQIFVRYVKSNYKKHQRLYKDIIGWTKIFMEFRPEKIDKSKYKTLKGFKKA